MDIQVQQRWLALLRLPTQWQDSLSSYPLLPLLLLCDYQRRDTRLQQKQKALAEVVGVLCYLGWILTPCLGSLSTCQQWCWWSHLHAASSMQSRLCGENSISHTESLKAQPEPVLAVQGLPSLQQWKVPFRLVSTTAFQPLEDMLSTGLVNWPPPLFTR